jgi:hypothetical protein
MTTICGHYTQRSGGGKLPVTARESLLAKPLRGRLALSRRGCSDSLQPSARLSLLSLPPPPTRSHGARAQLQPLREVAQKTASSKFLPTDNHPTEIAGTISEPPQAGPQGEDHG